MARQQLHILYETLGQAVNDIGKRLSDKLYSEIEEEIKRNCKEFKTSEKILWDNLGQSDGYTVGEFREKTGQLKDQTGWNITMNGVIIAQRNAVLTSRGNAQTPKGQYYTKPKNSDDTPYNPKRKNSNQYVRRIAVGFSVFASAYYADFVNNPQRRKLTDIVYATSTGRNIGDLWAGTGWFDIYSMLASHLFYDTFYYQTPNISINVRGNFKNGLKTYTGEYHRSISRNVFSAGLAERWVDSLKNIGTEIKFPRGSNKRNLIVSKDFSININI